MFCMGIHKLERDTEVSNVHSVCLKVPSYGIVAQGTTIKTGLNGCLPRTKFTPTLLSTYIPLKKKRSTTQP